jgi:hypothetical protein
MRRRSGERLLSRLQAMYHEREMITTVHFDPWRCAGRCNLRIIGHPVSARYSKDPSGECEELRWQ